MPFRTAISGMRAAQSNLEVIGHNVANSGTAGFKQARTEFADIFATTQSGGSTTPGLGVSVSTISQQFGQGNISITDNVLDMAVDGDGFFVVDEGGTELYTRAGAFGLDRDGFIVNAQNQKLVAFQVDANDQVTDTTGTMQLSTSFALPQATSTIGLGLNLDSSASVPATSPIDSTDVTTYNGSTSFDIYDSLGNRHTGSMYFAKTGANAWNTSLFIDGSATATGTGSLGFTNGILTSGNTQAYTGVTLSGGAPAQNFTINFGTTTQLASNSSSTADDVETAIPPEQNGYAKGKLSGISIGASGVISAAFTNGRNAALGQVALAKFPNAQGLQQVGNNNWVETFDSGNKFIDKPQSSGLGGIRSGALEDSNVDLTEELVGLIIAQRNFQANAEVISTADTITQTIINIR